MYSMTGYGRANLERDGRTITIELKSVNHRFLDLSFRMPRSLNMAEDAMRKRLAEKLNRGHVDLFASYRNSRSDARVVSVDTALAAAYARAMNEVSDVTGLRATASAQDVARMPDVLNVTEAEEDAEALLSLVLDALDLAIDQIKEARAAEGARMKADMSGRIDRLEELNLEIEKRYPETVAEYTKRLRDRIEELLGDASVDEARLTQEVAIMADRSAIAEENVRLKSHFEQVRQALEDSAPAGRKLDFIVQELNREFNTISSKSQDVAITRMVVEAKSEIEKLREQVQNVE